MSQNALRMKEIEVASSTKAQNFLGRLSAPENMGNSDHLQERRTLYFGILGGGKKDYVFRDFGRRRAGGEFPHGRRRRPEKSSMLARYQLQPVQMKVGI